MDGTRHNTCTTDEVAPTTGDYARPFRNSGDFERSYGFATAPRSYQTETEDEFNRAWGRLVPTYDTTKLSFDDNNIPRVYARTRPQKAAAET